MHWVAEVDDRITIERERVGRYLRDRLPRPASIGRPQDRSAVTHDAEPTAEARGHECDIRGRPGSTRWIPLVPGAPAVGRGQEGSAGSVGGDPAVGRVGEGDLAQACPSQAVEGRMDERPSTVSSCLLYTPPSPR